MTSIRSPRESVSVADLCRALANEDRVQLLDEIARDGAAGGTGLTIAELSDRVEITRFAASRHLGILRDAGLVARRRIGARSIHTLETDALETLEDWLYPLVDASSANSGAGLLAQDARQTESKECA